MLPQRSASSLGRPTRTELALLLAARPEPLRERMESADGNDTHEHGRDRDVSSASHVHVHRKRHCTPLHSDFWERIKLNQVSALSSLYYLYLSS